MGQKISSHRSSQFLESSVQQQQQQTKQKLEKPQIVEFSTDKFTFEFVDGKKQLQDFFVGFLSNPDLSAAVINNVALGSKFKLVSLFSAACQGLNDVEKCHVCVVEGPLFYIVKDRPQFDAYFKQLFKPFSLHDSSTFCDKQKPTERNQKLSENIAVFFDSPEIETYNFFGVETAQYVMLQKIVAECAKNSNVAYKMKSTVTYSDGCSLLGVAINKVAAVAVSPLPLPLVEKEKSTLDYTY